MRRTGFHLSKFWPWPLQLLPESQEMMRLPCIYPLGAQFLDETPSLDFGATRPLSVRPTPNKNLSSYGSESLPLLSISASDVESSLVGAWRRVLSRSWEATGGDIIDISSTVLSSIPTAESLPGCGGGDIGLEKSKSAVVGPSKATTSVAAVGRLFIDPRCVWLVVVRFKRGRGTSVCAPELRHEAISKRSSSSDWSSVRMSSPYSNILLGRAAMS